MIPNYLKFAHFLAAMARIDRDGIPSGRQAFKYAVLHEGRFYPPKLLVSLAHEEAKGVSLPSCLFSGGVETNGFLQRLGFKVVPKHAGTRIEKIPSSRSAFLGLTETSLAPGRVSDHQVSQAVTRLTHSARIYTWAELENDPSLPPSSPGIYAWFFKTVPPQVPIENCIQREGRTLLYVGISPESLRSAARLRSRIREHYRRTAEGSTLRKSLGCLLENELETILRRVGSRNRMTFSQREVQLSEWMSINAGVAWIEVDRPWDIEPYLIQSVSLPLNLDSNAAHPFCETLKAIRSKARIRARQLPKLER